MSKKLIAGAGVVASLAVALAPLATFAAKRDTASDTHTDTLKVNVPVSCAFGSKSASILGVSHAGKATWATVGEPDAGTNSDGLGLTPDRELTSEEATAVENDSSSDPRTRHDSTDEFSAAYTVYAGTKEDELAKTTLTVYCNSTAQEYTLTAKLNPLKHTDNTTTITPATDYSETKSGYAIYGITAGTSNKGAIESAYAAADGTKKFAQTEETAIAKFAASGEAKINESGDAYTMQYGVGISTNQKAGVYTGTVEYNLYQGV